MKKYNKILLAMLLVTSTILITSCGKTDSVKDDEPTETLESVEPTETEDVEDEEEQISDEEKQVAIDQMNSVLPIITEQSQLPQLTQVQEGETIAIIKTSMGDITVRFFPEYAPKSVENFLTHAKNGYYDGVIFHRVINDFVIQGGDPTGTGTGGESIYGAGFEDEISPYLKHFSGALAMANSGPDTNGSQFYIVENDELQAAETQYLEDFVNNPKKVVNVDQTTGIEITNDRYVSPIVANEYIKNGGVPNLDFYYTVFGQVIDGMDVVKAIGDVQTLDKTQGQADKPVTDVIINSVEVTEYKK